MTQRGSLVPGGARMSIDATAMQKHGASGPSHHSPLEQMNSAWDALLFIPNVIQMTRVILLGFVAREGTAAPTNPSKIVWVANLYLVFCLLGTIEAFALRHDMMTSGDAHGDFARLIARVHAQRSMLASALGMAMGRLGPVVFAMCIICIDQYEIHTLWLQCAIVLEVLSHWLYTSASLAAASAEGYVDHKPLKYAHQTSELLGPAATPAILREYYRPNVCFVLTACSEGFLITMYMLADPSLSQRSTFLLQTLNQVCALGALARGVVLLTQLVHSVSLLARLDLAIRHGHNNARTAQVIREVSGPALRREFGALSPKHGDGQRKFFE